MLTVIGATTSKCQNLIRNFHVALLKRFDLWKPWTTKMRTSSPDAQTSTDSAVERLSSSTLGQPFDVTLQQMLDQWPSGIPVSQGIACQSRMRHPYDRRSCILFQVPLHRGLRGLLFLTDPREDQLDRSPDDLVCAGHGCAGCRGSATALDAHQPTSTHSQI